MQVVLLELSAVIGDFAVRLPVGHPREVTEGTVDVGNLTPTHLVDDLPLISFAVCTPHTDVEELLEGAVVVEGYDSKVVPTAELLHLLW